MTTPDPEIEPSAPPTIDPSQDQAQDPPPMAHADFGAETSAPDAELQPRTPAPPPDTGAEHFGGERKARRAVLGVPIEVVISVGRARPLLSDLIALKRDSVLSLDSKLEDPVEIMIGGRVIARGELQELETGGQLGVRLTDVEDFSGAV